MNSLAHERINFVPAPINYLCVVDVMQDGKILPSDGSS
jgi:hypothetical protein